MPSNDNFYRVRTAEGDVLRLAKADLPSGNGTNQDWLNINLPSSPSDSLFSSWDLSGNAAIVDNIFWIEDGQPSESSLGNLNVKTDSGAYSFGDGISCFVTPAPHLVDLVLKYRVSSTSVYSLDSGFHYPNWRMYLRGPDHEDELLPNGSFFQFEASSEMPSTDVFIEWLKAEDLLASRHNLMSSAQSYLSHRYGGQACASHRITPSVFEDASYVDADDTCPFGRYVADGQGSETLYQVERTVRLQMVVPGGANTYSFPDAETPYEDDSELFLVIGSDQYAQVEIDLDVTTLRVKPL